MPIFVARYKSPNASQEHVTGVFEFESAARLGSKANAHDARCKMLELYGNDALTWSVEKIEHKAKRPSKSQTDGQMELDFREPSKATRHRRKSTKRGLV